MRLALMSGRLRTLHYIVNFIRFCVKRHQRANGRLSKPSTLSVSLRHSMSLASSAQNPSGPSKNQR